MRLHDIIIVRGPFRAALRLAGLCLLALPLLAGCLPGGRTEGEVRSSSVKGIAIRPTRADGDAGLAYTLVNEERARRGMMMLLRRNDLDNVAMAHARDLMRMNRLSHTSSDGGNLERRLGSVNWIRAGENLARNKGFDSPATEAVRGWIASPQHYENMFRADYTHTGMAALYDPSTGFTYFVQVFIRPAR